MQNYFTPSNLKASGPSAPTGPVTRLPGLSMARPAPKAIVIGSGFGGLAAAIRLSCQGWDVQVLEKLDAPGGRAYVWRQDGFTFDAGPTIITAPFLLAAQSSPGSLVTCRAV